MSQVKTITGANESPLSLLRDEASHRFIVMFSDKAWAQLPQESAGDFYRRLIDEFNGGYPALDTSALLERYREEIIADDYVDPILFESGFFRGKAHHDNFMKRVLANYEEHKKQNPEPK